MDEKHLILLSGLLARAEDQVKKYKRKQELSILYYDNMIDPKGEDEFETLCTEVTRQSIKDTLKMLRKVTLEVEKDL